MSNDCRRVAIWEVRLNLTKRSKAQLKITDHRRMARLNWRGLTAFELHFKLKMWTPRDRVIKTTSITCPFHTCQFSHSEGFIGKTVLGNHGHNMLFVSTRVTISFYYDRYSTLSDFIYESLAACPLTPFIHHVTSCHSMSPNICSSLF